MYRDWGDLQIEQRYSICFNLPQCKPCICTHLTVILIIMCGDWTKQILHTLNMSCTNWVYIFTISRPYKLHYTIYTEITSIIQHTDLIILLIFYNHNLTDRSFKHYMIKCTICTVPTGTYLFHMYKGKRHYSMLK